MTAACPVCGSSFDDSISPGTKKEYCSTKCRRIAQTQRRASRPRRASRVPSTSLFDESYAQALADFAKAEQEQAKFLPHTCHWCGADLSGTSRKKWCSRLCLSRARNAANRKTKKPPTAYQAMRREHKLVRDYVLGMAGGLCALCGAPAVQTHHILPLRDGGTNDIENLMAICGRCHYEAHPELGPDFRDVLLLS